MDMTTQGEYIKWHTIMYKNGSNKLKIFFNPKSQSHNWKIEFSIYKIKVKPKDENICFNTNQKIEAYICVKDYEQRKKNIWTKGLIIHKIMSKGENIRVKKKKLTQNYDQKNKEYNKE